MKLQNLYEISLDSACALDKTMISVDENLPELLKIREELKRFLMNLTSSHLTKLNTQRVHYLFVALEHLNNVENEIRVSNIHEEIIRLERIIDKIRSLKQLILAYIRFLSLQE